MTSRFPNFLVDFPEIFFRKNLACPDIIFHKRSTQNFEGEDVFLIEVKKGSANGDIKKVQNAMKSLAYKKGYCITNIGKNYVTLIEFYKNDKYKKRRYKIVKQESNISLEELNNGKIKNGNSWYDGAKHREDR